MELQVLFFYLFCVSQGFAHPRFQRNSNIEIVGGNLTDISKVPYQVAYFSNDSFCGGSIISKNFVMTAAHCCADMGMDGSIRMGSNYIFEGGWVVYYKDIYIPSKFNTNFFDYDICLLEMSTEIKFGPNVQPIPIADEVPKPEQMGLVAGWGEISEDGPISQKLLSVSVPICNKTYCKNSYPDVNFDLFICAGGDQKGVCYGDSGGALVVDGKEVGIVSFGTHCGTIEYPASYTSVANPEIRDFIKKVARV